VQMLRGKPYAQALRLQAEYAPEPPVSGGTPESTPAEITGPMRTMLDPFVVQARQIAAKL